MLKSKVEIKEFIKNLFTSSEIEINGVKAEKADLISLCERITQGMEKISKQKQYIRAGHIEKICITTY